MLAIIVNQISAFFALVLSALNIQNEGKFTVDVLIFEAKEVSRWFSPLSKKGVSHCYAN